MFGIRLGMRMECVLKQREDEFWKEEKEIMVRLREIER